MMFSDEKIQKIASLLATCTGPLTDSVPRYNMMSGGLFWEGESNFDAEAAGLTSDDLHRLWDERVGITRCLECHRTVLICSNSEFGPNDCPHIRDVWEKVHRLAPEWIGFHPERCSSNKELAELWQKENRAMNRKLEACDRLDRMKERKRKATSDDQPPSPG